jgi:radical SAM/Cys-rich protein
LRIVPRRNGNLFDQKLAEHSLGKLTARSVDTLQVNVGKLCNQACRHCHVDAGPHQTGAAVNMDAGTADIVIAVLEQGSIRTVDITGGAPELNPNFRRLVTAARDNGVHVMDRCNLSVLFQPGQEDLAEFLADHEVEVVASLPFYKRERTDRQRGAGVFDLSIEGLRLLNRHGYGEDDALPLNLVCNPVGAYLPGNQKQLEAEYRRELFEQFGIRFSNLYCITNMPIHRFKDWLSRSGNLESYMETLVNAFNPVAAGSVMCRDLVSIAPDGTIHDCDFNQMLDLAVGDGTPKNIRDFDLESLRSRQVVTGDHCLGCTAGAGSSCGGSVA